MKTKSEVLKQWKFAYNKCEKAMDERDHKTEAQYRFMLIAYSIVLEMSNAQIKKLLKIKKRGEMKNERFITSI